MFVLKFLGQKLYLGGKEGARERVGRNKRGDIVNKKAEVVWVLLSRRRIDLRQHPGIKKTQIRGGQSLLSTQPSLLLSVSPSPSFCFSCSFLFPPSSGLLEARSSRTRLRPSRPSQPLSSLGTTFRFYGARGKGGANGNGMIRGGTTAVGIDLNSCFFYFYSNGHGELRQHFLSFCGKVRVGFFFCGLGCHMMLGLQINFRGRLPRFLISGLVITKFRFL